MRLNLRKHKSGTLRLLVQPETKFRRMLIFGAGNAGLGNYFAWGFALVLLVADIFNSADSLVMGKIFSTAVIGGIPIGIVWSLAFAAGTFWAGKFLGERTDLPAGSKFPSFIRWWTVTGRALFPLTWVTFAICLDLILYDGANMGGSYQLPAGGWVFWLIKLAGLGVSFWWMVRLVKMRFGWGNGKATVLVFASHVLALAVCFLIFVLILGIPIR